MDQASVTIDSSDSDGDLLLVSPGINYLAEVWILNSGCSYHMCHYREWFDTYNPYNGGTVLIDNNAACKTIGIWIIKVKMFDGMVRALREVS